MEDDMYLINEAVHTYTKKYTCPYCNFRASKQDLIIHVNDVHSELIPKDYTASRVVFNHIYNKECGRCTECGKPTEWDEEHCRYKRQCSDECRKHYSDKMHSNVENVYGYWNMCSNTEHLKKMLAGRRISGKYRFKNSSGTHSYVASYEHKLLEFEDTVCNIDAKDLFCPGPIIEYQYTNPSTGSTENAIWITDQYYTLYNLIIEVKDGGDNPNTRDMPLYRAKQIGKEESIKKLNKYNYIRLTNNEFNQLLYAFAILKMQDTDEYSYFINESAYPELDPKYGLLLIQSFKEGRTISDWYVSNSPLLEDLLYIGEDMKLHKTNLKELNQYNIYRVIDEHKGNNMWKQICKDYHNDITIENGLFKYITGLDLVSEDQCLMMDDIFEVVQDYNQFLENYVSDYIYTQLKDNDSFKLVSSVSEYTIDPFSSLIVMEDIYSGKQVLYNKDNNISLPLSEQISNNVVKDIMNKLEV